MVDSSSRPPQEARARARALPGRALVFAAGLAAACSGATPAGPALAAASTPAAPAAPAVAAPTTTAPEGGADVDPGVAAVTPGSSPTIDLPPAVDLDPSMWVEPTRLDPTIRLDIRYATAENFIGEAIYPCPRCLLRPAVAAAIVEVHRELQRAGDGGLVLFDCYRPASLQRRLWEKSPDPRAVAPPSRGSMHARGLAVDLSIVDRDGRELDLGTPYDHFGPRAYHGARGLPLAVVERRERLRSAMERAGFRALRTEWWHYAWAGARASASDFVWTCPSAPAG